MAQIDDRARPRYLPLTASRRLEVDYPLDAPTRPAALTVVDRRGREIECDGEVIALAWRLTRGRRRPRTVVSALKALLDVALRRERERTAADRAARHVEQALEHDATRELDEPIPYVVVDEPSREDGIDRAPADSSEQWEAWFAADPDAPIPYALTDEDVDALAAEEAHRTSRTGRLLTALDRAAGGAR